MTAKYGTPYFSNYINSDMEPSDVRSMCCRLRLDLRELRKKVRRLLRLRRVHRERGGGHHQPAPHRLSAKDESDFYQRLDKLMDIAARSLKTKRTVITKLLEAGLYPYTKRYLGTFGNHFSTIGLIGMNEVGLNAGWLRADLTHKETQQFTKDVLNHMRERLSDYQEQYGDLYNLEATPQSLPPTAWPSTTESVILTLSRRESRGRRLTTPTAPIFRWGTRRIFSTLSIFRTSCRRSTRLEPYSTPSWARSCLTGRLRPGW